MDVYAPSTVTAATALRLLTEFPPHRSLGDHQVALAKARAAVAQEGQPGEPRTLAADLRAVWRTGPAQGDPVPWTLVAAVSVRLARLSRDEIAEALEVVDLAAARAAAGRHAVLRGLLDSALRLHDLAGRGILRAADVRLCLELVQFGATRAGATSESCRAWAAATGGDPTALAALADRLGGLDPRWAALRWGLVEAVGVWVEAGSQEPTS